MAAVDALLRFAGGSARGAGLQNRIQGPDPEGRSIARPSIRGSSLAAVEVEECPGRRARNSDRASRAEAAVAPRYLAGIAGGAVWGKAVGCSAAVLGGAPTMIAPTSIRTPRLTTISRARATKSARMTRPLDSLDKRTSSRI